MDTASLKSFATSARVELIREIGARITAVLAQGSPERVEQLRAVTALERTIAAAGGGDKGKMHVADKVAYTWFNRIIALRFMDANGYTGIGVVSPAAEQVGQPEVLASAKRGQIDGDVVKGAIAATITGLLNGTRQPRPGVDAQVEAYALLLADYCRYWNRAMPFMFEREGDYTELLIPANLLAEDSVLNRSVKVLTEEVCQDVEVIGWLYQFYISERKDEVFAGFKKNKKAGADEIPAATQLFTPHWIVRYLVENSLGRLWMLNHPESRLVDQMDYYIAPVDEETEFLRISTPEDLKVIDPACGSGHMLTYAFDLLYAIYEEEGYTPSQIPSLILTRNLFGAEIDPRAGALAALALTMKAAAKRRLFLKNPVEPNICTLDPISFSADELSYLVTKDGDRHAEEAFWNQFAEADTFGSLIQPDPALTVRLADHLATLDDEGDILRAAALNWAQRVLTQAEYLLPRYSVVVANPPYMGGKNMSAVLSDFAQKRYADSKTDLFAMFVERALVFAETGGVVAMITMQSWMFLSSYEALRTRLFSVASITSMAHLGAGAFDTIGGEVVSTTAFTLAVGRASGSVGSFFRLTESRGESEKASAFLHSLTVGSNRFTHSTETFARVPGGNIAYWLEDDLLSQFSTLRPLSATAEPRQGIATADNERFLRFWWEPSFGSINFTATDNPSALESGAKWFPMHKGGAYRRWYGNHEFVIDWHRDGHGIKNFRDSSGRQKSRPQNLENNFKSGITWTAISTGGFSARFGPSGFISNAKGPMFYPPLDRQLAALGYVNSSVAQEYLDVLAPTLDYSQGPLGRLPVPLLDHGVDAVVEGLVEIAREQWSMSEKAFEFREPPLELGSGRLSEVVEAALERQTRAASQYADLERQNDLYWYSALGVSRTPGARNPLPVDSTADLIRGLISYSIGCMFGRYSLNAPGLVLGDQGATLEDYLAKVPTPTFLPDADNVIPIVDGDWFEDDIAERFRLFLRTAFGEKYFEENLRFVTKSLGVRDLRDYFVKSFYQDHVQRYKKRPIYWLFSSPKGSFNALIYMHRYTPSTVSTVLTYLREYETKLESALQQAERVGNAKEADRLRKILVELNEYEHDTLFPKASENVVIDLDDGVKANYPKFGTALKKIPGLEAASD